MPEGVDPREGRVSTSDERPTSKPRLRAWVLATVLAAAAVAWWSSLGVLASLYLCALLILLPHLANVQMDYADQQSFSRLPAYASSGIMLVLLGAIGAWLGHRHGGWEYLALSDFRISREAVWTAALTGAALLLMMVVYVWRRVTGTGESVWVRRILPKSGREKAAFAVLSVTAGVGEEIAFRGFALSALTEITASTSFALAASSSAFGLVHAYQGSVGMVRAGLLGLMFSVPVVVSGSLWPAIAAHVLVDWIGGLLVGERLLGIEETDNDRLPHLT